MTHISLLLVSITASFSLVASQSQVEKPKSKWPFEAQIGANFIGYNSHDATGPDGTAAFSASSRLAPSIRLSIDPICLPFGSILFSAGYKFENDVPLDFGGRSALSDLKHKNQLQAGALLRFETSSDFEFGVGVDVRYDWMKASHRLGTRSEGSDWRPWLRANARYMFDKGTRITPFVGIEAAYALTTPEVDPADYYHDYVINTGDALLGNVKNRSPHSFAKGNFPSWEVVIAGGIRFGRRDGCKSATPVKEPKKEIIAVKPPPPLINTQRSDNEAPVLETKRQVSETEQPVSEVTESECKCETREICEAAKCQCETTEALEAVECKCETHEIEKVPVQVKVFEIETLMIHFPTNGYAETLENRAIVKTWAVKYKNIVEPSAIFITGHCDGNGAADHNKKLSENRANSLAESL
ncbi:MAG: hypothetical protein LBH03_00650, partial [Holophagales bacterium]|nr:hypothetical protein [Holophagales bacterium]